MFTRPADRGNPFKRRQVMYTNTGYLNPEETELENLSVPLRINSCGVYRLISRPDMFTLRPAGRPDYQLLYIASGSALFYFSGSPVRVSAGSMVLYRPQALQHYIYYLADNPEVYWVHFTGYEASALTEEYAIDKDAPILHTGVSSRCQELFLQMIRELQIQRPYFEELLPLLLRQLFLLVKRQLKESPGQRGRMQKEMEHAIQYFHENFARSIQIEDYARDQHMSTCWFIRSFRQYTGVPPLQYLTSLRITRAKELLESTDYDIGEIGLIAGYENPLYFSRIFKKHTGISPAEYRKTLKPE